MITLIITTEKDRSYNQQFLENILIVVRLILLSFFRKSFELKFDQYIVEFLKILTRSYTLLVRLSIYLHNS